jgi:tRNA(adenine34) deaminase
MKAQKKMKSWRLEDCEIYVTMEPCPMCAGAMIQSRVKKVYYGVADKKSGVATSICHLFDLPFNHKVETEGLIMHKESEKILKSFFQKLRER